MSWPSDQSPGSRQKNSPDWSQRTGQYGNYRSPFPSPRNGQDFGEQSPMKKNFGWRNNSGYNRFQNDRFHYSPGGNRRGGGGHFRGRGGGHFRGSPTDSADISLYVNTSMLSDPWKELEKTVGSKSTSAVSGSGPSDTSTPNSTSLNTSVSNNGTKENLTEESVVISDDSSDDVVVSDQTVPGYDGQSPETNPQTLDSPSTS